MREAGTAFRRAARGPALFFRQSGNKMTVRKSNGSDEGSSVLPFVRRLLEAY
jgi:hypothetical protein